MDSAIDWVIGFMGMVGTAGLIIWGAADIGIQQGKRMAYREFQCPGSAQQIVFQAEQQVKCIPYWSKP